MILKLCDLKLVALTLLQLYDFEMFNELLEYTDELNRRRDMSQI